MQIIDWLIAAEKHPVEDFGWVKKEGGEGE